MFFLQLLLYEKYVVWVRYIFRRNDFDCTGDGFGFLTFMYTAVLYACSISTTLLVPYGP